VHSRYSNLFVWNDQKVEDVRFWCEPKLTVEAIGLVREHFDLSTIDGFVGIEARGFYLAGVASVVFELPVVMVRKHKKFYEEMAHERVEFKNWKAETESLTLIKESQPDVRKVLVIDDILDTGASLAATTELLKKAEIEICGAYYLLDSLGAESGRKFQFPIESLLTRKLFS